MGYPNVDTLTLEIHIKYSSRKLKCREKFEMLVKLVLVLSVCILFLVVVLSYSYGRIILLKSPKLTVGSILVLISVIALIILGLV